MATRTAQTAPAGVAVNVAPWEQPVTARMKAAKTTGVCSRWTGLERGIDRSTAPAAERLRTWQQTVSGGAADDIPGPHAPAERTTNPITHRKRSMRERRTPRSECVRR